MVDHQHPVILRSSEQLHRPGIAELRKHMPDLWTKLEEKEERLIEISTSVSL